MKRVAVVALVSAVRATEMLLEATVDLGQELMVQEVEPLMEKEVGLQNETEHLEIMKSNIKLNPISE